MMKVPALPASDNLLTDPSQQQKAFEYLEALKKDDQGWQRCVEAILSGQSMEPQQQFLLLQVIEAYLLLSYETAGEAEQQLVRRLMEHWLGALRTPPPPPLFLGNKMARVFALVFVADFPRRWPRFMHDVFLAHLADARIVEFYLRTLLTIDSEVADREIQRSKQEAERNTLIKDQMRVSCVAELVDSWTRLLADALTSGADKVAELCLNVAGCYVAWIDVALVVNERFVPLVVAALRSPPTSEAAADCVCSLVSKGMDAASRVRLVQAMDDVLGRAGLYALDQTADADSLVRLSEIVNCFGVALIECWERLRKEADLAQTEGVLALVEAKLPQLLFCLASSESDVAANVTAFSHRYVLLLKQLVPLNEQRKNFAKQLLVTALGKYRLPDDFNHDVEGEDEAEFLEFRKEIKPTLTNIGVLDQDLMVDTVVDVVGQSLQPWQDRAYQDLELAITLVYLLGEVVPSNQGSIFSSTERKAQRMTSAIRLVITSGVSNQRHVAVVLAYFDTVCRYDKLFVAEPALVPPVLASFLDDRGLRHAKPHVRSRAAYLFGRFVKSQKAALQPFVEQILSHLGELLAVRADTDSEGRLLTSSDQLFIYEATGTLIVFGNFSSETKRDYMRQLVGGLVQKFVEGLAAVNALSDAASRAAALEYLNQIIAYTSRTTKAFSNQISVKDCQCSQLYLELMKTFVTALSPANAALLQGLRQYMHRMVVCLEDELLADLPTVVRTLVSCTAGDVRALHDLLVLVQQIVSKYQARVEPALRDVMGALLDGVWAALLGAHDADDETARRDLLYLWRAYLQVLNGIVTHGAHGLLVGADDDRREKVLASVYYGATQLADPLALRQSFGVMHKLMAAVQRSGDATAADWLHAFVGGRVMDACFTAPLRSHFDLADAQYTLVLHEIALCLKSYHSYKAARCAEAVMAKVGSSANELVTLLTFKEVKPLQKFLKDYFVRLRSCDQ